MTWNLPNVGWALQIANIVVTAIWFVAVLYFRAIYVSKSEFEQIKLRLIEMESQEKVAREKDVATKSDIGRIITQLTHHDDERHSLGSELAAVKEGVNRLTASVAMISQHLMERGK